MHRLVWRLACTRARGRVFVCTRLGLQLRNASIPCNFHCLRNGTAERDDYRADAAVCTQEYGRGLYLSATRHAERRRKGNRLIVWLMDLPSSSELSSCENWTPNGSETENEVFIRLVGNA